MKQHTTEELPYQCVLCNVGYDNTADLSTHMLIHTTTPPSPHISPTFQCPYCQIVYNNSTDLSAHMLVHSDDHPIDGRDDDIEVEDCSPNSMTTQDMTTVVHRGEPHQPSSDPQQEPNLNSKGEEAPCDQCDKIFMSKEALEFHVKQMHTTTTVVACPICFLQLSHPAELYQHLQWHSQLSYQKSVNNLQQTNNNRKEHVKKKTANSPNVSTTVKWDCRICGKDTFESEETLQIHMSETHGMHAAAMAAMMANNRVCYVCEQNCNTQEELTIHMQQNHPREYLYIVQRMHNGVMAGGSLINSYPCQFCPLNFGDSESLSMHQDTVHKKLGISSENKNSDPVLCAQCNSSFANIYSLAQHVQTAHGSTTALSSPYVSTATLTNGRNSNSLTPKNSISPAINSKSPPPLQVGLHVITPEGLSIRSLASEQSSRNDTSMDDHDAGSGKY